MSQKQEQLVNPWLVIAFTTLLVLGLVKCTFEWVHCRVHQPFMYCVLTVF